MSGDEHEEPLLVLPEQLRTAFKDPFGPIYTEPDALLADAGEPVLTVGDMVTFHLEATGYQPQVALIDGRTERQVVADSVQDALGEGDIVVSNPAGTLTVELLTALERAVAAETPQRISVEGEEDLAAIPAVLVAPVGATVVYGQPQEGMVAITVTAAVKERFRELLEQMDGDSERALSVLE